MPSRQHSGTRLYLQDGENPLGDGDTIAAREGFGMAVWSMRWLQSPLCEEFTQFHVEIAADTRARTPTNDRRDDVSRARKRAHALNRGGAIV
jgi:hypothetical protein